MTTTQNSSRILALCLCALFTALSAVGAFLKIPIPYLPITMQNFFTTMAGFLLGPRLGAASVGCYVLLGFAGVPIFTEGGGFMYAAKPSFGYLLGFIAGAYVTGKIAYSGGKSASLQRLLAAAFAGTGVIYVIGMCYFFAAKNLWIAGDGMSVWALLTACFFPVIPGDIIKCICGALLAKKLIPLTARYRAALKG
ncbi:MAG: biotin transporter BioY [Ruminococcus sp.]|nr:biotin transporter BioY [Ruminococcus sp.]